MARPKRALELRREYHIGVRFSAAEHDKISKESEELGVTLSSYIRSKALQGYIRIPKYAKIDVNCMNQLSKLGGLLKKLHTESDGAYREQTAVILDDMRQVIRKILSNLE